MGINIFPLFVFTRVDRVQMREKVVFRVLRLAISRMWRYIGQQLWLKLLDFQLILECIFRLLNVSFKVSSGTVFEAITEQKSTLTQEQFTSFEFWPSSSSRNTSEASNGNFSLPLHLTKRKIFLWLFSLNYRPNNNYSHYNVDSKKIWFVSYIIIYSTFKSSLMHNFQLNSFLNVHIK